MPHRPSRLKRFSFDATLAVATAALCAGAATAGAQHTLHPLSTIPLGDRAYDQLEGLARQGCAPARVSAFRPYEVRDVIVAVRRAMADSRCAASIVAPLRERFVRDTAPPAPLVIDTTTVAPDLAAAAIAARALRRAEDVRHSYVGGAVTGRFTALGRGEFRPLFAGVRPASDGTPPAVLLLRARGVFDGGPRFVAVSEGYVETSARNDPQVRSKVFAQTAGVLEFNEAYANGRLGPVTVSFGRSREAWGGEGEESLVLSANAPPIDRLLARGRFGRVEARALFATLDPVDMSVERDSLRPGSPVASFHRFLVAHALSLRPTSRIELTLGETILSSRRSLGDALTYANVLMPIVVTQADTGLTELVRRDNLTLFGLARLPVGPAVFEGELFVDDFQYGQKDRQRIPDQLAWRLAASAPVPALGRPASVRAELRHVNTYTYQREFYTDVYQTYNRPLGSELGPDADIARVGAELWANGSTVLAANVGRWRQGALRIDTRPGRSVNEGPLPFPSTSAARPAVQTATLADASLRFLRAALPLTARVEAARIQNAANVPRAAELYVRAQLIASYAFRYP